MHEHEAFGPKKAKVSIVVVSDKVFKGLRKDESGLYARERVSKEHEVVYFSVIPNSQEDILNELQKAKETGSDVLIFIGGSGLGPNDLTVDVVSKYGKEVPGFGEIFRLETYRKRGPIAILTRAGMWIVDSTIVVVTPGSKDAVSTALDVLLPVLRHLIAEVRGLRHNK
ncbi:molybdenum cofactor biosynthesis protein [Ignicoccus islandicus DSM 13165]|uniref:Molybdenum cofactor biosynthesis protein n=1 Tax=Ignicoccus islandicus DSM 13165 TaxID=940295 RepID=A0A0U3FQG4_9CREN|nr:MogA/MoaB family molybdenum cofactor biosynthesis protein [Ignicoccus islandicus]ALU11696.1 molybdenum cofactor biosynthesis protein [Ignicoccus islandicus DSM 13165]